MVVVLAWKGKNAAPRLARKVQNDLTSTYKFRASRFQGQFMPTVIDRLMTNTVR